MTGLGIEDSIQSIEVKEASIPRSETRGFNSTRRVVIPFRTCIFEIYVKDSSIALDLSSVLEVAEGMLGLGSDRLWFSVLIDGFDPYDLWVGGDLIAAGLNRIAVFTEVMRYVETVLLGSLDESECAMHASSVLRHGRQVVFAGPSGSGKTSTALVFSQYGLFLGDECGFLDMELGSLRYEPLPFQLKSTNSTMLDRYAGSSMLEVESSGHGRAFYIARSEVACCRNQSCGEPIGVIVFPRYDPAVGETTISKTPSASLPEGVLGALIGRKRPSRLLSEFFKMSAIFRILFLNMSFSNVDDASNHLDRFLTERGW